MDLRIADEHQQQAGSGTRVGRARPSEAVLVAHAKAGHKAALSALFKRYQRTIFGVARRMMRNHEDAEDVVQQSFQRAFMHLDSFHGDSKFSTWLTRIAMNEALMMMRRRWYRSEMSGEAPKSESESDTVLMEMEDSRPTPEQRYAELELRSALMQLVFQLRPTLRTVIVLHELKDFSTAETADVLGISVAAVKARLFHARSELRKKIQRHSAFDHRTEKTTVAFVRSESHA
jgi:RNA polymerase sigma-70 factor (ECF subfamily)